MMNTLTSRLFTASLIVLAGVLAPAAAFAQDASTMMENSSPVIGALVVWLLPIGGLFAVGVMLASDKNAQSSRTTTSTRR
jgi:hypothetical protein